MKVVYRKSIVEQMDDAINNAKSNGKKIDKFILTREEIYEFISSPIIKGYCPSLSLCCSRSGQDDYRGYLVESE